MPLQSTVKLKQRLRQMARRERNIILVAGIAKVLIALGLFSAIFFLLDWFFVFSAPARAFLLLAGIGAAGWIAKTELHDPLRQRRDEITTALKIEKKFPELQDRLISVVQLAGEKESLSPALLERLESETAGMTTTLNFSEIINWRFFRKLMMACAGILVAGILCGVIFPQYAVATFRRMFFGDVRYPSLTRIALSDVKTRITRGDDWVLNVTLSGKIPSSVILKMKNIASAGSDTGTGGGKARWVSIPLKPILGYTYGVTLEKAQQSFEFQVFAGDGWTDSQVVKVLVPVAVFDPVLDIQPPGYSGQRPVTNAPLVGSSVLEGSTVTITVPASKGLVSGALQVAAGPAYTLAPLTHAPGATATFVVSALPSSAPNTLTASNGVVNFTVRVKDVEDLENEEPLTLYSLRVQPDQEPRVRLVSPKSDRISVPYAQWKMTYEATDDFGLSKAWLVWEVFPTAAPASDSSSGTEPTAEPKPLRSGRIELRSEKESLKWTGEAILDMVAAKTTPGETVVARIEVADARVSAVTNGLPDPAVIGKSSPLSFAIVDESEKWTEILQRLGAVEEVVVRVQDRQETVRKEVEGLKK
jgi:hypothetical protein